MKALFAVWIEPRGPLPAERQLFSNRQLYKLIVPMMVEQVLALLVGLADTLMISYAGEAAVSGVSLVNQLNNIFIFIFGAVASGGAVIASQYVGKGDRENGLTVSGQLITLTLIISMALTVFAVAAREPLLGLLFGRVESDVMSAALTYLVVTALSFPALALYNTSVSVFRSMSRTKAVMNVSLIANAVNLIGNAIGIFLLHAGVMGVAVPTLISRVLSAVIMLVLARNPRNILHIRLRDVLAWHPAMIRRVLRVALPNGFESGLFHIAKVALSGIVALFGTSQIAANGIAQSFWSMAALFSSAMGYAFVTVIGQCIGAGDAEAADYYCVKLLKLTYLCGVLWNLITLAAAPIVLRLYSLSAETSRLVLILVLIHNCGCAVFSPIAFALSSGLRAAGDIRFTVAAGIFSTVVCRVVFSVVFGIWLGLGVIGIALAMVADWAIRAGMILWRYRSEKWKTFRLI